MKCLNAIDIIESVVMGTAWQDRHRRPPLEKYAMIFSMYLLCSSRCSVWVHVERGCIFCLVIFDRKGSECKFRINFTDGARLQSLPLWESARAIRTNQFISIRIIWFVFFFFFLSALRCSLLCERWRWNAIAHKFQSFDGVFLLVSIFFSTR